MAQQVSQGLKRDQWGSLKIEGAENASLGVMKRAHQVLLGLTIDHQVLLGLIGVHQKLSGSRGSKWHTGTFYLRLKTVH